MEKLKSELAHLSKERKRTRKKIFKVLRENREFFVKNGNTWLVRKMDYNYMGDLSDNNLESYLELLAGRDYRLKASKKEHNKSYTFDERNIVL